jgi:hypothetical protein
MSSSASAGDDGDHPPGPLPAALPQGIDPHGGGGTGLQGAGSRRTPLPAPAPRPSLRPGRGSSPRPPGAAPASLPGRALTPATSAWATTCSIAPSARRRGSQAGRYEPWSRRGMASSTVPARRSHPGAGSRHDPSPRSGRRSPSPAHEGADLGLHQQPDPALQQAAEPLGVSLEGFTDQMLGVHAERGRRVVPLDCFSSGPLCWLLLLPSPPMTPYEFGFFL